MKIIQIYDDIPIKKKSFSDYINVTVEYKSGDTGLVTMTRAKLDRIMLQVEICQKYNITEEMMDNFVDKCFEEEQAEHIWDECD